MINFSISPVAGPLIRSYPPHHVLTSDVLDSNNIGTVADTWVDGAVTPTHTAGSPPSVGGVILTDGRIVFAPLGTTSIQIYNPSTGLFTAGPVHGMGTNAYRGGILLPSTRQLVLFIPYSAAAFGIFDVDKNQFYTTAAHGIANSGTPIFGGASLGFDDMVYLAPGLSTTLDKYDWTSSTPYTVGPTVSAASGVTGAFNNMQLLPNGDIGLMPGAQSSIWRYRPSTGAVSAGPNLGTAAIYDTGCLTKQGLYAFAPKITSNVRQWDWSLDAVTVIANISTANLVGTNWFCGVVLCRDGRLALIPRDHTNVIYVDPTNVGSFTIGAAIGTSPTTTNKYRTVRPLNNGTFLAMSYNAANAGIFTDRSGGVSYSATLLSDRFFNNC